MAGYEDINEARLILGLSEEASLKEIRDAFTELSVKYHPDKCSETDKEQCAEMFKKISHAKDTLKDYCANYRLSFREKDVRRNLMSKEEYEHLMRFYDGWWADLDL